MTSDTGKVRRAAPFLLDPAQQPLPGTRNGRARNTCDKEQFMLDVVMLALGLGFFAAAVSYTYACERL